MPVIKGGRPGRAVAPDEHGRRSAKASAGQAAVMRRASAAMIVLLVIQSGIGIVVNLDATIPAADSGAGIGPAVGQAISAGPPSGGPSQPVWPSFPTPCLSMPYAGGNRVGGNRALDPPC